jgi:hypothetical protein
MYAIFWPSQLIERLASREFKRSATPCRHVRFSNWPAGVKRFQTIRRCSVNVAHGLALLFGIGTKALPVWDRRRGGSI